MSKSCSSHNLSQLEELTSELKKDGFALNTLIGFEFQETTKMPEHFNEWVGLLYDRIDIINQHIQDVCTWENALRSETDFNGESDG